MAQCTRRFGILLLATAALVLTAIPGACGSGDRGVSGRAPDQSATAGVIDSTLPIPVLLERFRRATPDTVVALSGGDASPERLARALLRALSAHDSSAVAALVVSRAEFAWLYYPFTKFVARPYELGPDLVWLTHAAASEKGARRLLARYGGRPLRFSALTCAPETTIEGPNTLTVGCETRFAVGDSTPRSLHLFGALLNRDGRYKFLSYANDL